VPVELNLHAADIGFSLAQTSFITQQQERVYELSELCILLQVVRKFLWQSSGRKSFTL